MKQPGLSRLEEDQMCRRLKKRDFSRLILIFTEGSKTEPQYFQGFKRAIEKNPSADLLLEIVGVGKGTLQLLVYADAFLERYSIDHADVWLVMDKDDFPDRQFDGTVFACRRRNQTHDHGCSWFCAWSNECFELWFLLHFCFYQAAASRREYIRLLNRQFSDRGIPYRYTKSRPDLFELLNACGSPKFAVQCARKLYAEKKMMSPSKAVPCTTVFELVLILAAYLPEPLRSKFMS